MTDGRLFDLHVETPIPSPTTAVGTVGTDQGALLRNIAAVHFPDGFDCDLTYGNGQLWTDSGLPEPSVRLDVDLGLDISAAADSVRLPIRTDAFRSVVFDPPFLTYIRSGRDGNGSMVMARRFGGYWRYDELEDHYRSTFAEIHRVLTPKGRMLLKCQDIVHNHRLHPTGTNCVLWAAEAGLRLVDQFVLTATHRMPGPNRKGTQRHARIHHCWLQVYETDTAPAPVMGLGDFA